MTKFRSPLAAEILSYLKDHPDAQDTKEGIVEWWLLHQRAESVDSALTELVDQHFLVQFKGADAKMHYRIAPGIRDQLQNRHDPRHRRCQS